MKFIFCIIALLVQPVFSYVVYRKQDKRQAALQMPLLGMSALYLIIQFFVFFKYCIKFPKALQGYSYLIQGGILLIFLLVEFAFLYASRYINTIEKQEQDSIRDFKDILQALEVKRVLIKDAERAELLNGIYDKMRYADAVSSSSVAVENKALMELVQHLSTNIELSDFEERCTQILELLEVRNIKLQKVRG